MWNQLELRTTTEILVAELTDLQHEFIRLQLVRLMELFKEICKLRDKETTNVGKFFNHCPHFGKEIIINQCAQIFQFIRYKRMQSLIGIAEALLSGPIIA